MFTKIKEICADVGKFISSLDLSKTPLFVVASTTIDCHQEEEEEEQDDQFIINNEIIEFVQKKGSQTSWEEIENNGIVKECRKDANLNVTFSTPKLVKQMILSCVGLKGDEPEIQSIMGRNQKKILPYIGSEQKTIIWPLLMSSLSLFSDPIVHIDKESDQLRIFASQNTKQDFMQGILSIHSGIDTPNERFKNKYLKKFPHIDPSIIKTIILI